MRGLSGPGLDWGGRGGQRHSFAADFALGLAHQPMTPGGTGKMQRNPITKKVRWQGPRQVCGLCTLPLGTLSMRRCFMCTRPSPRVGRCRQRQALGLLQRPVLAGLCREKTNHPCILENLTPAPLLLSTMRSQTLRILRLLGTSVKLGEKSGGRRSYLDKPAAGWSAPCGSHSPTLL